MIEIDQLRWSAMRPCIALIAFVFGLLSLVGGIRLPLRLLRISAYLTSFASVTMRYPSPLTNHFKVRVDSKPTFLC
jgi:hypothetical protein